MQKKTTRRSISTTATGIRTAMAMLTPSTSNSESAAVMWTFDGTFKKKSDDELGCFDNTKNSHRSICVPHCFLTKLKKTNNNFSETPESLNSALKLMLKIYAT